MDRSSDSPGHTNGVEILVVEDSLTQAEQLKYMLERHDYRVSHTRNGKEAIVWLRAHKPTLIISDINMPEMDGYELCRRIRSDDKLQDLPVILLTALTDPEDVVRGLECGAENFITKPYEEGYLLARVRYILSNRHLREYEKTRVSLEVFFAGKKHVITADRLQILNLLLSTYETAVLKNHQLEKTQTAMQRLNEQLEERVQERTAALRAENEERKRVEMALRASEERYHNMFENVVEGIFQTTPEGRFLVANPALARMYGYESPETLISTITDIGRQFYVDPNRRAEFQQALEKSYVVFAFESQVYCKDRRIIWISENARAVRDESGRILFYEGTTVDITERKRAEERIREQAALLDRAQDAIFVRDLEQRITYWNKGAERIYGWTAGEVVGQRASDLLYKEVPPNHQEILQTTLEKGEWVGELRQITKADKEIIVVSRRALLRDDSGKPQAILNINSDITEKKRLEGQSLRAQRLESIGTLAGGIAHDLNNVLAPILMAIDILRLYYSNEEAERILATIESSARRGADMVKQVLTFARGVQGERVTLQIGHLIKEVSKILRQTFPKSIEVRTALADPLWPLVADTTQLHQVLMNLCVNGRDAMPHGGTLTLQASNFLVDEPFAAMHSEAKVGPFVVVRVTDTGTGIPAQIRERIFDPFFSTKSLEKGTGLGLSTVRGIVKSHGGFVTVYSEVGRGTEFHVYLPAQRSASTEIAEAEQRALPGGNGELVLVVDDEAAILDILKQTLTMFGYQVLTARDGTEAITLCAQHRGEIKVMLTDMMMPVMDGPAAILAVRRIDPQIRIIAASGLGSNVKVTDPEQLQVEAFLGKPYTADKLIRTVHEVLASPQVTSNPP